MNRRGFMKALAGIPLLAKLPKVEESCIDHTDCDPDFADCFGGEELHSVDIGTRTWLFVDPWESGDGVNSGFSPSLSLSTLRRTLEILDKVGAKPEDLLIL